MGPDLPQIGVIADVISEAVLFAVEVILRFAGEPFGNLEGLQDRAVFALPPPRL